ncbi:NAD(P)H-hydrate dehydratase [Parapedobacter sp. 10938]|uniref:NAD(P)H-hydrate dehydratase n=1 Tax=Parapedobacter flavus TaxID=3110225 RepID=UPI002DBB8782|nr:NAD(P)H-hydrate dehydratase [Parapedobacter sp. 10938]MEC3880551.1 NAD(P)H-hydrate dehydratase [Parapedobacter sp. 10938]
MKTIMTAAQTRDADRHTIEQTPITSLDLMENAAMAFTAAFMQLYPDKHTSILVCCGTGNNGGDGLAIARLLQAKGYDTIAVWVARYANHESDGFAANLSRLHLTPIPVTEFFPADEFADIQQRVIIDALLGSGLNKSLNGDWLRLAQYLNQAHRHAVAVDIPSGLRADGVMPANEYAVYADEVITFHRPKLSFFFPESARAMARFHVVDIGMDNNFIEQLPSNYRLVETADIQHIYRQREQFSHKGTYGHALIVAGSRSTMGAAILASGASVYAGAGLTSACTPQEGLAALNTRYPEVMFCSHEDADAWEKKFDAVAIGPGLDVPDLNIQPTLINGSKPLVIDADALSFLGKKPKLLQKLPKQSILTPHMKEFDRLFGQHNSWWERLQTAREQAVALDVIIILKNRYTFIALPDGDVAINPTGNPAMASGGMGDVLTGILVSFLAQGYAPREAALLGCYLHGLAGDRLHAAGMAIVPATRIITELPYAIASLND